MMLTSFVTLLSLMRIIIFFSGTGFSLWILIGARTKIHRLKSVLLKVHTDSCPTGPAVTRERRDLFRPLAGLGFLRRVLPVHRRLETGASWQRHILRYR